MKRIRKNVDEILQRSLPSASTSETSAALDRISRRLWSHGISEDRTEETLNPVRRRSPSRWLAAAAIVVAAITIAVLFPARTVRSAPAVLEDGAGSRSIRYGEVVKPQGAGTLRLVDGSRVELGLETEVSLEHGNDGVRLQVRRGDVIVNAAERLMVHTRDVSAVGKIFLVNAKEEGSRVAAIGSEARVQQGQTEKRLLTGEQMTTNPQIVQAISPQDEIAWVRGLQARMALAEQAVVEAQKLAEALKERRETFEVISIRLSSNLPDGARGGPVPYGCAGNGPTVDPGRIVFNNQNLYTLAAMANDFNCIQAMSLGLITGGPSFVATDQYLIEVTIPKEAGFQPVAGRRFSLGQYPKIQTMFRNMLEDRFKLVVHREKKEVPGYALTVAKGGHKLRADAPFLPKEVPTPPGAADMRAQGMTMAGLANFLSTALKKPVVDRTGIAGSFPIFVYYAMPDDTGLNPSPYPGLTTAIEEQLGLKLESIRTTVDTLVIDHAEKPTEN
jgi:uncharacterized protein (TIGR03435 family)